MKGLTIILLVVAVLACSEAEARRGICKPDLTNTNRSGHALPRSVFCANCRTPQAHPSDFRNFAFNWLVKNAYTGIPGNGTYRLANFPGAVITQNPVRMTNPVCNYQGQCMTVHLLTHHDTILSGLGRHVSAGVDRWQVQVQGASGDVINGGTFYPGQSNLPVPANNVDDPKISFSLPCLDNFAIPRPTRFDSIGGGSGQSWHDRPDLWGYTNLPVRKCGYSTIDGRSSTKRRTCGWF